MGLGEMGGHRMKSNGWKLSSIRIRPHLGTSMDENDES